MRDLVKHLINLKKKFRAEVREKEKLSTRKIKSLEAFSIKMNVCVSSELDLFARPPYQTSILSSRYVEYTPSVNFEKGRSPINVKIVGTKGEYIDLSNIYVYIRASIVNKSTGASITESDEIAPINYIHNTMFKQVDVYLDKKLVSVPCDYAYRSYIESLLNFGKESKQSHLEASLWYKDKAELMDSVQFKATAASTSSTGSATASILNKMDQNKRRKRDVLTTDLNDGLIIRRSAFQNKTCELYGQFHVDIFNIEKYLLDEINLEMNFVKNDDKFCLIGKEGYELQINDFIVNVRKIKISDKVLLAHAMALERSNAIYPITRVNVQARTINQNVLSDKFENLISGPLPKRIVIGMVESEAYNGSLTKNPFNFQNFSLKELNVTIDGEQLPYQPFQFNYTDSKNPSHVRGYYSLFQGIKNSILNGNDISFDDYANGYHLIALDLSQDGCLNTDHFNPEKTGNLRINFRFDKVLEKPISVILYYESQFEVTKLRNVDYQYIS